MKLVELFAGTGAFSLAFRGVARTVFANDMCVDAKHIFDANHGDCDMVCRNIHDLSVDDIPDADILTAGFPCQSFSIAGKKLGFDDERATVIWKMLDIIRVRRPSILLLENVKNLVTHDGGHTLKRILGELQTIGYATHHKVLNTCKVTRIPQNRERLFIVGFLDHGVSARFHWNIQKVQHDSLVRFLEPTVDDRYYYTTESKIWDKLVDAVTDSNTVYQYRRGVVRANKTGVVPTLTTTMGTGGHNVPIIRDDRGIRKLTPRECFTLQGFTHDYQLIGSDSALYRLVGNCVTVAVVRLIAERIMSAVRDDETRILIEYYENYLKSCELSTQLCRLYQHKSVRRPVFPEVLSENIVYRLLKMSSNVIWDTPTGDLMIDGKRVEVKCSTSTGPISFGPRQEWDRLYLVNAHDFMLDQCIVYEINASKSDFNSIQINKSETFGDQCLSCRRPRMTMTDILRHFESVARVIYDGSLRDVLK